MKKILLLVCTLLSCSTKKNDPFIQKVLTDVSKQSYFLALDVSVKSKKQRIIIKNSDFVNYFEEKYNNSKEGYISFAENIIHERKSISLNDDELNKFHFIKVNCQNIENEKFKTLYDRYVGKNNVLNKSNAQLNDCLIYLFFKNSIASRIDDESGYIVVEKL